MILTQRITSVAFNYKDGENIGFINFLLLCGELIGVVDWGPEEVHIS